MHGIIFLYLQKFAQQRVLQPGPLPGKEGARDQAQVWERLLTEAGLRQTSYSAVREYPDEDALALVGAASRALNLPVPAVLESFGEFLAPELLELYNTLIPPDWKTLDVIANTEELIHAAVRVRNPGARPPVLLCLRTSPTELQIMYSSRRRMCSLAKGIVTGLARHFGETVAINDEACMLRGDPFCALQVIQLEPADQANEPSTKLVIGRTRLGPVRSQAAFERLGAEGEPGGVSAASKRLDFLDPPRRPDELGRLSHYRVFELLGHGSMGVVLRAEDIHLERLVALKVMQPNLATDAEMQHRFLREARALAGLKSDHVITVYEVGLANELPFLAMELLDGETLEAYQERTAPVPLRTVLRIGQEIAAGLAAVHAKGLIHRDIKPCNLWVESPSGRIKILDFGLARGSADLVQSAPGLIMGTPGFMAPEQANGQRVDQRSDLFSLGCVLYWLCTGERPFQGVDLLSTLTSLATHQPQLLVRRMPHLPPALGDLVMQLLDKDPHLRPASSRLVANALAAIESSHVDSA